MIVKRCNCFIAKRQLPYAVSGMERLCLESRSFRSVTGAHTVFHADAKVIIPRPYHAFVKTFS
jgi:hypothetical protein